METGSATPASTRAVAPPAVGDRRLTGGRQPLPEPPAGRRPARLVGRVGYPTATLLALFLAWELATHLFTIPAYLLPPPSAILLEIARRRALLLDHGLITLAEILAGFALSVLVGVPLALLIAFSRPLERALYPLLVSSQTVPKVAIAPLFIVWFGFGWTPKIVVAFLIAFFPVVIDTVVGLRSTPPEMVHLARSMGASPWQTFWLFRFPHALPNLFAGLKVAITLAVVGAIVGEFVGADRGLGYLIQIANGNLDTLLLFASIGVLSVMGVVLFFVLDLVESLALPWHVSKRLEELHGGA